jgi:hypothetical protein
VTDQPVVLTNREPVRQVRRLLRALEQLRIRSDDPAVAETSVSFTWGRASIDVAFEPPRCFEVDVRSNAPLADTPKNLGWKGAGRRRHGRWKTTFAETVAARISRVIGDVEPGRKRKLRLTVPSNVSVRGETIDRWLEERSSPVPLKAPVLLATEPLPDKRAEALWPNIPMRAPNGGSGVYGAALGWPTTERGLFNWCRAIEPITKRGRDLLGPPAPAERFASRFSTSIRLDAVAAAGVRARIADELACDDDPYRARAGAAVLSSGVVLLGAPAAEALFDSEPVPAKWLKDIRLPLPIITVLISAPFRIPSTIIRVANSDPEAFGWFSAHASELDASALLLGFTVFSDEHDTVDGHVLWHLQVNADLFTVPALFRRSRIGHVIPKTAAWLSTHRPLRTAARRVAPRPGHASRRAQRASPPVVEVRIEAHTRSPSTRPGSGRGKEAHLRRGHWRRQRVGPRHAWHYELRWIAPTVVGGSLAADHKGRVYTLPG